MSEPRPLSTYGKVLVRFTYEPAYLPLLYGPPRSERTVQRNPASNIRGLEDLASELSGNKFILIREVDEVKPHYFNASVRVHRHQFVFTRDGEALDQDAFRRFINLTHGRAWETEVMCTDDPRGYDVLRLNFTWPRRVVHRVRHLQFEHA